MANHASCSKVKMNTLDKFRLAGFEVAAREGIVGGEKLADVPPASDEVDDLECRVMDNLNEFNTFEQFDGEGYDLFRRAFLYLFGKGAEYAFFARMDYELPRFPYHFDEAMRGQGATKLPEYVRTQLDHKRPGLLAMYEAMATYVRTSRAERSETGPNFNHCMYTVLSGSFYCGREYMLTLEPREEDGNFAFDESEEDVPYDPDTCEHAYALGDLTASHETR